MWLTVLYIIMLLLILLFDIGERRILNVLVLPGTVFALIASLAKGREAFLAALAGAVLGFLFFFALYWIGRKYYGTGAMGFGDVKLAVFLGAIVGVDQVLIVLASGMLLAGLVSALMLATKRGDRQSSLPYGAFMAFAGIIALLWSNVWAS
jgi:leader peptidase (prepilin peptidase)/N-methyltransferase